VPNLAFIYMAVICVCLFFMGWVVRDSFPAHSCQSTCVVHLPVGTEEDDFAIDYRHGGTLRVWINPNH
jgi:hypothetical protein